MGQFLNNMIYNTNKDMDCPIEMEAPRKRYEEAFVYEVCKEVVSALNIQWKDREIVKELLFAILHNKLCKRDGLLEQYLHSQLDIIKKTILNNFKLSKDIETNYNYATHAKFNDIIKAIKEPKETKNEQKNKIIELKI